MQGATPDLTALDDRWHALSDCCMLGVQKVAPMKLRMPVVRPKLSMMAAAPRSAAAAAWRA